jgi:hypothetical protein
MKSDSNGGETDLVCLAERLELVHKARGDSIQLTRARPHPISASIPTTWQFGNAGSSAARYTLRKADAEEKAPHVQC